MTQQVPSVPVNTSASGSKQTTASDSGFSKKGQSVDVSSSQIVYGDGDTAKIPDPSNPGKYLTVRLPWDSPETKHTRTSKITGLDYTQPGQDYGDESAKAFRELLKDKKVTLVNRGTEGNNRTLVSVLVDGKDLGLEMVRNGHAWSYSKYNPQHMSVEEQQAYKEAQTQAMKEQLGLWRTPSPEYPELFRRKLRND